MELWFYPYLGIPGHDPIFEFQFADRGFWQSPWFSFGIPDAGGGFYLVAQCGFAVGDAHAGWHGQRSLIDDQFNGGEAALSLRVFTITGADQGLSVTRGKALGAGRGGRGLLEDDAFCQCAAGAVGRGTLLRLYVEGYVYLPASATFSRMECGRIAGKNAGGNVIRSVFVG